MKQVCVATEIEYNGLGTARAATTLEEAPERLKGGTASMPEHRSLSLIVREALMTMLVLLPPGFDGLKKSDSCRDHCQPFFH